RARRISGRWQDCHRTVALALAGGAPDRGRAAIHPLQLYPFVDCHPVLAPAFLSVPAANGGGSPLLRGDTRTTLDDGCALFRSRGVSGLRHAPDPHRTLKG